MRPAGLKHAEKRGVDVMTVVHKDIGKVIVIGGALPLHHDRFLLLADPPRAGGRRNRQWKEADC